MQLPQEEIVSYIASKGGVGAAIAHLASGDQHALIGPETSKLKQLLERQLPEEGVPEVNDELIFVLGFCRSDVRFYLLGALEKMSQGFTEEVLGKAVAIVSENTGDVRGAVAVRDSIMAIAQSDIIGRMFGKGRIASVKAVINEISKQ